MQQRFATLQDEALQASFSTEEPYGVGVAGAVICGTFATTS